MPDAVPLVCKGWDGNRGPDAHRRTCRSRPAPFWFGSILVFSQKCRDIPLIFGHQADPFLPLTLVADAP